MSSDANKKSGDSEAIGRIYWHRSIPAVPHGQCAPPETIIATRVARARLSLREAGGSVPPFTSPPHAGPPRATRKAVDDRGPAAGRRSRSITRDPGRNRHGDSR